MCGIAGIYAENTLGPNSRDTVRAMIDEIAHRGPDHSGIYAADKVVLGHALLAIIGLGTGQQPLSNENDSVWVTYNGEIYNFLALKKSLLAKGHKFKTETDTEVLVHLYEEYGLDFVHHLNGMFAIALWDSEEEKLILVRDRLGVKPLYWAKCQNKVYFASEIKSLLRNTPLELDIDPCAIDHYLAFKNVGSTRSISKTISKLPPGCMTVFDKNGQRTHSYWAPIPRNHPRDPGKAIPRLISQATKDRLKADVPLSVSLSGGIDSSIVLYETVQALGSDTTAFSIRYPNQLEDESGVASRFARKLGVTHEIIDFPGLDVFSLPTLAKIMDEPFGDYSAYPSYMLFKEHRKSSTVVLTGDGGDEAFGGYKRYILNDNIRRASRFAPVLKPLLSAATSAGFSGRRVSKLLEAILANPVDRYESIIAMMSPRMRADVLSQEMQSQLAEVDRRTYMSLSEASFELPNLESILDYLHYLPGDVLAKVDITSMANSVEVRSPFLDYRVAEYGLSLPSSLRFGSRGTKIALRDSYRGKIPDEILDGNKRGFTVPMAYWHNDEFRDFAYDILLSSESRNRGVLSIDGVSRLLDAAFKMDGMNPRHVWNILMLELWFQAYAD